MTLEPPKIEVRRRGSYDIAPTDDVDSVYQDIRSLLKPAQKIKRNVDSAGIDINLKPIPKPTTPEEADFFIIPTLPEPIFQDVCYAGFFEIPVLPEPIFTQPREWMWKQDENGRWFRE